MGFQRILPFLLVLGLSPHSQGADGPRVNIQTSMGDIVVELHDARAPATVENFLSYVKDGFYEGTVFHRVIDGFMIQGGGMTADLRKKPTRAPVMNEADNGLKNDKGTLAMARTSDPHSATAQFFINVADNDFLNHSGKTPRGWGYAVFGRVVTGMEVVERIEAVPTGRQRGMGDVPREPVIIEGISLVEGSAAGE
ncbi:MAG: peptidylprolyl isomerase [Gammaproteobacteria bacterium]|nr:peptidylprolyl isomerase [Gammaproteobacteria bacterium]